MKIVIEYRLAIDDSAKIYNFKNVKKIVTRNRTIKKSYQ